MKRSIKLIFGKTGTGKSLFTKRVLLPVLDRSIIIDAMLEYENGIVFNSLNDLLDYCIDNDINEESEFCFVCRFTSDNEIEGLFEAVFELSNLTLVVEEAEIYISPYAKSNNFLKLVRYGRHKGISIIGIARRTSELSQSFRAQTDEIISFKQTDINDLKKMSEMGLNDIDKLSDYIYPQEQIENIHFKKVQY